MRQTSFFFLSLLIVSCFFNNGNAQNNIPYFQQEVNYSIHVILDDTKHELKAEETIEYINNSSDTLSFLYFHLWPNAYKNKKTALAKQLKENGKLTMEFLKPKDCGFIDQLDFKVGAQSLKWELDPKHEDICKIFLNHPLLPGNKITINTPFHVKIPSAEISRLGHVGQAYAITQWYPKPAVYDNEGWHPLPYLDQGEFYSEYGSFDVFITLPENYVVGATGDLVNGEKELKWMNSKVYQTFEKIEFRNSQLRSNSTPIDSMSFPASSPVTKTLHYHQENVHDFAWFADKRFNVLKGDVILPANEKKVTCWALFTDNNFKLWTRSIEYLKDATYYYSLWNGNYAYNQVTAVDGTISAGGGMEYPNITIIGEASNDMELETVIMHEVGHNWFYGMLGSNERDHAWMDEGLNSFNELRYIRNKYPNAKLGTVLGLDSTRLFGLKRFENAFQYYLLYVKNARENKDQAIETPAAEFTSGNYGAITYSKTAIVFDYLFQYMGEKKFDEAMQFYFQNYHFKHPQPADLQKTLEFFSGKDLGWLFKDLIQSTKKIDYKIKRVKKNNENGTEVLIKNCGEINGPVLIGESSKGKLRSMVWYNGFEGEQWLNMPSLDADEISIDPFNCIPELNRKNNTIRTHGLLRKTEPFEMKFGGGIDYPKKNTLYWLPVAGYNTHNGVMAGIYLHNYFFLEKKFQFDLAPLYGFGNQQLAGFANASLQLHPQFAQSLIIGSKLKRFAFDEYPKSKNYSRIENFIIFELKKKKPRSPVSQQFSLHHFYVNEDKFIASGNQAQELIFSKTQSDKNFVELRYQLKNKRVKNYYSLNANFQSGGYNNFLKDPSTYSKLWTEFNFHLTTNSKNNGWDLRAFAGYFLTPITTLDTRFRMNGIYGSRDYTYSNLFIGRNESNSIHQQLYVESEGGFKTRMFIGQSSDYLLAINIKTPRLLKSVGLFADIGTCSKNGLLKEDILYDAGINIDFFKDVVNVYLPLVYSNDIKKGIESNDWNFFQRIMINVRIDKMNPKFVLNNIFSF